MMRRIREIQFIEDSIEEPEFRNHRGWIESKHPIGYSEEEYEERPLLDPLCKKCDHSQMRYYNFHMGNYKDKFKSNICIAGKVTICKNGFIRPEEFEC